MKNEDLLHLKDRAKKAVEVKLENELNQLLFTLNEVKEKYWLDVVRVKYYDTYTIKYKPMTEKYIFYCNQAIDNLNLERQYIEGSMEKLKKYGV